MRFRISGFAVALSLTIMNSCTESTPSIETVYINDDVIDVYTFSSSKNYVIANSISFASNVVIESGVDIQLDPNVELSFMSDLHINGTAAKTVNLVSSTDGQTFNSITFRGDTLVASHVNISNAEVALLIRNAVCEIRNLVISDCDVGFWSDASRLYMEDSRIDGCNTGARFTDSDLNVDNIDIANCQLSLELSSNRGSIANSILSSSYNALYSINYDSTEIRRTLIDNNNVAIQYYYGYPVLLQNEIRDNRSAIQLRAYPRWAVSISENDFINNQDWNLFIEDSNWDHPHRLSVANNYWGSTNEQEIAAKIRDGIDMQGRSDTLDFVPFQTSAFGWLN